jgi:hypothetical protein
VLTGNSTTTLPIFGLIDELRALKAANSGKLVLASCGADNVKGLKSNHVYSVLGYDQQKEAVHMRNPWGHTVPPGTEKRPGVDDGEFVYPLKFFQRDFRFLVCED